MSPEPERMPPPQGILFVVSAPSGAGKSTLTERLMKSVPGISFSVSTTTRPIRSGEQEGVDYHYVDHERFEEMIERGEFIEHATVHGHHYGTRWETVEKTLASDRDLLLDIDVQGAAQIRGRIRNFVPQSRNSHSITPFPAVFVFIMPPSLEILAGRLRGRGTDSEETIRRRLENAEGEMRRSKEYDHIVINADVDEAAERLISIVRLERLRVAASES